MLNSMYCPPTSRGSSRKHAAGFSLVELMVSLVVGLIVTGAAVGFVVSVAKANSEDIRVTRLTQEVRSLSEIMSREIRRARYVQDPIARVGQADAATGNDAVTIQDSGRCITLAYDEPPPGAAVIQRSIYLNTTDGRVYFSNNATCNAGNAISSREVIVEQLQFTLAGGFQVDQSVRGRFRDAPSLSALRRQFNQTVFIRSGQVE